MVVSTATKRSDAQKAAHAKYEEKRKGKPRLPGGVLTEEEARLLSDLGAKHGGKKEAIIKGLKLLEKLDEKN